MAKVQITIDEQLAQDTGELAPTASMQEKIVHAIRQVYDPELPVNVYDLGLIYTIAENAGAVTIEMTLTAPNCPVADKIPADVAAAVRKVPEVQTVDVKLVWQPAWTQDRMSDAAKLELGIL